MILVQDEKHTRACLIQISPEVILLRINNIHKNYTKANSCHMQARNTGEINRPLAH